jgi:hypothetical protein
MKLNEIPKFIVNLKRRPDRLERIKKQMEYLGWDYEVFEAIDTNSYMGITKSQLAIIQIAKERGYSKVMIMEDDCEVMPYAKDFIEKLDGEIENLTYAVLNLSPTLNRHINKADGFKYLLDMTNLPEKHDPNHRDIYAANMIIYDESIYDEMFKISEVAFGSGDYYYALDDFTFQFIVQKFQSYCPIVPVCTQGNDWSDISQGNYNNFYLQTYNWNLFSPTKIPGHFCNAELNKQKRDENIKETIDVN